MRAKRARGGGLHPAMPVEGATLAPEIAVVRHPLVTEILRAYDRQGG